MPNGAVGPNHVMTMLSSQVRITDRKGATVYSTVSTLSWWSALISGVLGTSDVRMLYDPYSDRWIAVSDVEPLPAYNNTNKPYVFIAASQTSDPTGAWYGFKIPADSGNTNYADYTMLGFNKDKIVVTFNSYAKSSLDAEGVGFLIFNKTNLYGGVTNYQFIYKSWTNYGFSISPVVTYDPTETNMWTISTFNSDSGTNGYLSILDIEGSVGSCTISQSPLFPRTSAWAHVPSAGSYANFAPQLGTSELIYTFDDRIMQSMWRNGSIWCAQTIYLPTNNPTRCSIQWWQIDPLNGSLQQIGRIDDPTGVTNYAYPSLSVNKFNDVLIGYSRFSSNQYASANYTFHAYNDPLSVTDGDYLFQAGVSPYWKTSTSNTNDLRNRWGDFTRATVDPVNDVDFWTVQEYAAQMVGSNVVNESGQWAVAWANLQMTPTNNMFSNAIVISGFDGVSNVSNVRATTEPGEPTNFDGKVGGASVWYAWTAPGTGYTLLATYDADFPTLIGVYTGSSVSNLTSVATAWYPNDPEMDDFETSFNASEGTTYYIAIDGVSGSIGTTSFEWEENSAPQFMLQPQPTNILAGSNVTFTAVAAPAIISYQWKFNGANIAGATNSAYTIDSPSTNQTGNYSANATNAWGWTNSTAAWLQVYASATPVLSGYSISNNKLSFTVSGITNSIYLVQATTNIATLTNWVNIYTGMVTYIYLDPAGVTNKNYLQRYYRALWAT